MKLKSDTLRDLRRLIVDFYSLPFDEALIRKAAEIICRVGASDYFAFYNVCPRSESVPAFFSNSPSEYIPVYRSVSNKDFLLELMIDTHTEYVMRRNTDLYLSRNQDFVETVQRVRPISDIAYIPIERDGVLQAFCAIGKADLDNTFYTDEELDLLRFAVSFMGEAFNRPRLQTDDNATIAYLDYDGTIVRAGDRIREVFTELWGGGPRSAVHAGQVATRRRFDLRYREFLRGPFRPGMDSLVLKTERTRYRFRFFFFGAEGILIRSPGVECASVSLIEDSRSPEAVYPYDARRLIQSYKLTPREREVIDGIYRGFSNKRIALELCVDESTVKRHTHNIYEKTGCKSRVELLLRFARD